MRFVDLAASARMFMNAVRALPHPPRANKQLNGCGRSFLASFLQAARKLRDALAASPALRQTQAPAPQDSMTLAP